MSNEKMALSPTLSKKYALIIKKLDEYPEGLTVESLSSLLGIPRRTLFRHMQFMEGEKLLTSVSGIWKQCQNQAHPLKMALLTGTSKVQGHKIQFVLDLIEKPDWWEKRENRLMRIPEVAFKSDVKWGNNRYQQIILQGFLVQTFPSSIVFIPQKKYWGEDPYECFIDALQDALKVLGYIEQRYRFKFFKDMIPHFRVKSNHYVSLNDALAQRCKEEKQGFLVEVNEEERVTVDLSQPFGLEATHKKFGVPDMSRWRKQVEDVIVNDPKPLSEQQKDIEEIKSNQSELFSLVKNSSLGEIQIAQVIQQLQQNQRDILKEVVEIKTRLPR